MAVKGQGANTNKEPVMRRVSRLLEGSLPESYTGEAALSNLFRRLIRRFTKSPLIWRQSIEALVSHKEEIGELDQDRAQGKRGNLSSMLAKDTITWKSFIDAMRLIIFIPGSRVFHVSLTVTVKRKAAKGAVETIKEEIILHDEET